MSAAEPAVGDTDLIKLIKGVVNGQNTATDVTDFLKERPAGVNVPDKDNNKTPLHWACSPMSRKYQCRDQVIETLLDFGANSFLTDKNGTPCVLASPDPRDREAAVSTFLRYRMEKEMSVESVPPMGASRLMKRSEDDRGYGVFSTVATHCLFYLYKGALYLWDTKQDVEHVIFQPRHVNPDIAEAETKLASFMRKKSFVAHGGQDDSYDFEDEEHLTKRLKRLEGKVALITHFVLTSGLDSEQAVIPPGEGVAEWIITDTGEMIHVEMNAKGIRLGQSDQASHGSSFYQDKTAMRRKSHVCGAAASYEQGTSPMIKVYHNVGIRYHHHTIESGELASNTCCAIDGRRGVIAYVVAPEPESSTSAGTGRTCSDSTHPGSFTEPSPGDPLSGSGLGQVKFLSTANAEGDKPFGATPHAASAPLVDRNGSDLHTHLDAGDTGESERSPRRVSFGGMGEFTSTVNSVTFAMMNSVTSTTMNSVPFAQSEDEEVELPPYGIFKTVEDEAPETRHVVFRVVHTDMVPKGGLSDAMKQLTRTHNPRTGTGGDHFRGCRISEFKIPYPVIDADLIAIKRTKKQKSGEAVPPDPISVQQLGTTKFILFTKSGPIVAETETAPAQFHVLKTSPQGEITFGTAKAASQVGRLRTVLKRCFFVEVSEVVEVLELDLETYKATPIFRSCGDREDLHKVLPIFHPTEESLCLLYQAIKRQEVCKLDLNTLKYQSVCRLPKPSSLRFYATVHGQQTLSELYFAFARNGQQLLRYNISMHVMSIYSWDEMTWQGDQQFINCTMVRNPVAIAVTHERQVTQEVKAAGDACTWLVMQSQSLASHILSGSGAFAPTSPTSPLEVPRSGSPESVLSGENSGKPPPRPETEAEVLLGAHFASSVKAFGHAVSGKPARIPEKTCCWSAAFPTPLDAVRCGLKLLRSTMDKIDWPEDLLEADGDHFQAVKMPYRPKTVMEKKYPSGLEEIDENTPWENRGPKVRLMVVSGHLNDHTALVSRDLEKVITQSTDGVLAVDGTVMKVVKPLMAFAAPCPVVERKIGRVTVMVPQELESRMLK